MPTNPSTTSTSTSTPSTEDIARSVARALGDEALVDKLAALKPSELTSLLLAVHRAQAERRTFPSSSAQFARDELFRPSVANARALRTVEDALIVALDDAEQRAPGSGFELIELAPVAPLGLAALTGIDPNNVLAALRNAEVLADPTAAMALVVAARRRSDRATHVHLASSSRAVRMQPLPKFDGASRHFRLFALTSSARGRDDERAALLAHIRTWLVMLAALAERGFTTREVRVELGHVLPAEAMHKDDVAWRDDVVRPWLAREFPDVAFAVDELRTQGRGYYESWLLHISAKDAGGTWLPFGDGGVVPWTGRMIGDAKERLVTSGFGAELIVKRCAKIAASDAVKTGL
jgi:hypothetical protein